MYACMYIHLYIHSCCSFWWERESNHVLVISKYRARVCFPEAGITLRSASETTSRLDHDDEKSKKYRPYKISAECACGHYKSCLNIQLRAFPLGPRSVLCFEKRGPTSIPESVDDFF